MGRQRTGDDRSLLERDSRSTGASSGSGRSTGGSADRSSRAGGRSSQAGGQSSQADGRTSVDSGRSADSGTSRGRSGIWDADSLGQSEDAGHAESESDHGGDEADRAVELREGEIGQQSDDEQELADGLVEVDVDELTDRQLEVLETAHDLGYYQYPRGANASEVADALDICPSTLAEHLAAAQTKLLADVLGEREA